MLENIYVMLENMYVMLENMYAINAFPVLETRNNT